MRSLLGNVLSLALLVGACGGSQTGLAPASNAAPGVSAAPSTSASVSASAALVEPPPCAVEGPVPREERATLFKITGKRIRPGDVATGFMDRAGHIVVPVQYNQALPFSEGLAAVRVGDLWGFIDETGRMVISPRFIDNTTGALGERPIGSFSEGLAAVILEKKPSPLEGDDDKIIRAGFIDHTGKMVIGPTWLRAIGPFHDGRAQWVPFIDTSNGPPRDPNESLPMPVTYIDTKGKAVFTGSELYSGSYDFSDGFVFIPENGHYKDRVPARLVDVDGKTLAVPEGYEPVSGFREGLARIMKVPLPTPDEPHLVAFIDTRGTIRFTTLRATGDFHDGRATVSIGPSEATGYVDACGKLVIPEKYFSAHDFSQGVAKVDELHRPTLVIDTQGHLVADENYKVVAKADAVIEVGFYLRSISNRGAPRVWGYLDLATGKYPWLSEGTLKYKGEAWVREKYGGPPELSPLAQPKHP